MTRKKGKILNSIGIKSLKIFKAKASIEMRKRYSQIYKEDIDTSTDFNRNNDYLYYPKSWDEKHIKEASPWYGFKLIKATSSNETKNINDILYLLNFLNWAIYYYNNLIDEYENIPKDPKKADKEKAKEAITQFTELLNIPLTKEEETKIIKQSFKKNNFILKPSLFLKLYRFFVQGWYDEYIEESGSVKFAHYMSEYIINNKAKEPKASYYDASNENQKKEVSRLFEEKTKEYKYNGFHIKLEKYQSQGNEPCYAISITQYDSENTFHFYSRLHHSRYKSSIIKWKK